MQQILLYIIYGLAATRFYQIVEDIYAEATEQIGAVRTLALGLTIFCIQGMIGYVIVWLFNLIKG